MAMINIYKRLGGLFIRFILSKFVSTYFKKPFIPSLISNYYIITVKENFMKYNISFVSDLEMQ